MMLRSLSAAVETSTPFAQALFDEVRARTADEAGISREPYGEGEQIALGRGVDAPLIGFTRGDRAHTL